mgnify:CR=1 FL=1
MQMGVKRKRSYSKEFKKQAVEMMIYEKKSVKDLAKELGVPVPNLNRWRSEFLRVQSEGLEDHKDLSPASMEQEIRRLKRELSDARLERDILKKAVSIFSQERGPE